MFKWQYTLVLCGGDRLATRPGRFAPAKGPAASIKMAGRFLELAGETLHLLLLGTNVYYSEGSQAVSARPSGKGGAETR